ncbi:MAG: hypothetical protein KF886_22235 [Candidatus Hydrogenedentes bacterium]|nr:hypothetical protein [Candidatus Hydrogenedentota bacterium]
MNTTSRIHQTVMAFVLATLLPLGAGAEAILHGRVSFDAGGTLVKGAEESDWTSASVNTLILPKDTLWADQGGTAEIEFSGGTFLRLADGSKAEVVSLPPSGVIRGWVGSFYVHRLKRSQGEFVFETPAASIQVEKDSMVRIDILGEGMTTVSTRWGQATIRTDAGGAVQAYQGKRVYVEAGLLPSEPVPFDRSAEDAFDRWNRERTEYLVEGPEQTRPVEVTPTTLGVRDLDRYGEWVYIDNRPFWRPTVIVDYTPYRYGYWNHVGRIGNVWVGSYPFSYVTSHYGYWDYVPRYGWVWSYDRVWSPAWAATVRYGDYFVWAPVNRYYRPVYPTTSAYFTIGGVSFGYFGTSCVRVSEVYLGPSYVHFASYDPFRRYYSSGNVTVNIWNINYGSRRPHVRVPYNNSVTTVRDYTPRRSIRGAGTLYASGTTASQRVQRLESEVGRGSFTRTARTGGQNARTDIARIDAGSRTRNVRLTQEAPDYTRASRSNPVTAGTSRVRATSDEAVAARDRQGGTRSGAPVTRAADTIRGAGGDNTTDGRTSVRGATPTERTRGDATSASRTGATRRTDIDPGFDDNPLRGQSRPVARTRTAVPTEDSAGTATRSAETARTRTPGRTDSAPTATRSAAPSTRTEAPRVNVAPDRVAPSAGRTAVPEASAPSRSARPTVTERPSSSTARTAVPEASAPSRSARPTVTERPSTTARTAAPEASAPSRSARPTVTERPPTATRTAPSSQAPTTGLRAPEPSRGQTLHSGPLTRSRSGEVSQPRIIERSAPPTSRSYTAPSQNSDSSRSYTAPSQNSNSGRSYTAPSRSSDSGRSYTAPSRSSDSGRSYTAPSQNSNSSRSYTAPSRGSSSSSGASISRPSSSRSDAGGRSISSGRTAGGR